MVNIPTSRDVAYVNPRSGRIAPSGPSVNVGAALQNLGEGVQQAAYNLNDLRTAESRDNQAKLGYDVETRITEFRAAEEELFNKARESSSESGIGFTRSFLEGHQKRANDFIKANFAGVSEAQNANGRQSLLGLGNSLYAKAYDYEQKAKTNFYDRTTNSGLDTIRTQIRNNAAPFDDLKRQGLAAIDAADMPEPWKAERRALWDADAAESKWRWKFEQNPQQALSDLRPSGTKNLIRKEEGFRSEPYWDVNAWRIGYGSDTVTTADGKHIPVKPGMKITQEDAERDLQYRLSEREGAQARKQVGDQWGSLGANVQAALESVAYNYGSLPNSVVQAVKSGDNEKIAQAIEALPANRKRRGREAAVVRGSEAIEIEDEYAGISYDRREQLAKWGETEYTKKKNEQSAILRGEIEIAAANAPSAIQNTGAYSGTIPTAEQFIDAYGPQNGAQKYNELIAAVETSQQAYKMQTMSEDDITAVLSRSVPTSSGNTAALDAQRYDVLASAAQQTLKAREADPSAYVQQAFPSVKKAWEEAKVSGNFQPAMAATAAAQTQLGIEKIRMLPKEVASDTIAKFNDENAPGDARVAAVTGLVFSTPDPKQRRAIYEQLVEAGLPDTTEGAMDAFARGDMGAGRRLMEAAIIDPAKLPGASPYKTAEINDAIQTQLMDEGQVGDLVYGLSDGVIENQERAIRDAKLLTNAVSIRVRKGEDLDAAVLSAAKDLYGDVQAVSGNGEVNAQLVLPTDADPEPILSGLAGIMPTVRSSLETTLAIPDSVPTADGSRAVVDAARQNYIENVLSEGYFRNAQGGFVFIDPYVGAAIAGPDGKAMIFTEDQVKNAPAAPAPKVVENPDAAGVVVPKTQEEIDLENYGPAMADQLKALSPPAQGAGDGKPTSINPGFLGGEGAPK